MDSKKFINLLRRIINEEVRIVVREELSLLNEQLETVITESQNTKSVTKTKPVVKNARLNQVESMFGGKPAPNTKKTVYQHQPMDPIKQLLAETKAQMSPSDYQNVAMNVSEGGWVSNMPQEMMGPQTWGTVTENAPNIPTGETVQDMIANAEPAYQPEHAKVDVVPDFSSMMSKLKEHNINPNFK